MEILLEYSNQIQLLKYILYIIVLLFVIVQTTKKEAITSIFSCIIISLVFCYFVSTPIVDFSNWGDDHSVYAAQFYYSNSINFYENSEFLFGILCYIIRCFSNDYVVFFFVISILYCLCHILASKNYSKNNGTLVLFIMFISSLFFVSYGVNTIRSGLAMSLLILAFSFYKRNNFLYVLLAICAINIHVSVALTLVSFIVAIIIKKPKMCFTIWLISIILSVLMGSYFEEIFANMIEDDRTNTYLLVDADQTIYNVGFRWDFVIYSMIPIIVGYYFIYKKKFTDNIYNILYCTYLLANTFWILVIRANFTDRFAYLSWALMPIILIYPLINGNLYKHQNYAISLVVFLNVAFTFILSL